jgi:hypothetical protein
LEESAYREVSLCDVVVCIVGGRYGSESSTRSGSITQNELKEALVRGVQVYVFVESSVHSELSTYRLNKDKKDIQYSAVDNPEIYSFLEQVFALPQNNPITPFTTSAHICSFLRTQWAGLFQRYLQEHRRVAEVKVLEEMKSVASTLQQLVEFLTQERKNKDDAIKNILLANHPAFRTFGELLETNYRIFFSNESELDAWLKARGYRPMKKDQYDEGSVREWWNESDKKYIRLLHPIFDEAARLIAFSEGEWDASWVELKKAGWGEEPTEAPADDEIPF